VTRDAVLAAADRVAGPQVREFRASLSPSGRRPVTVAFPEDITEAEAYRLLLWVASVVASSTDHGAAAAVGTALTLPGRR
jgi:hypothetical protein